MFDMPDPLGAFATDEEQRLYLGLDFENIQSRTSSDEWMEMNGE